MWFHWVCFSNRFDLIVAAVVIYYHYHCHIEFESGYLDWFLCIISYRLFCSVLKTWKIHMGIGQRGGSICISGLPPQKKIILEKKIFISIIIFKTNIICLNIEQIWESQEFGFNKNRVMLCLQQFYNKSKVVSCYCFLIGFTSDIAFFLIYQ